MNIQRRLFVFLGCLTIATLAYAETNSTTIRFTTLNIEWFGLGGSIHGSAHSEHRDQSLKKFISEHMLPSDVIAFQEIVDVPRLTRLLPEGWHCTSYDRSTNPTHQYVVLCASASYSFKNVAYDNNNLIDNVAYDPDRTRPAIRVELIENASSKSLVTVVAVHLKASPEDSYKRRRQVHNIGRDLTKSPSAQPIVILGDFNSFQVGNSPLLVDDVETFEKILKSYIPDFKYIKHIHKYTFRNADFASQFDQFYVYKGKVKNPPHVFEVCNNPMQSNDFFGIHYFNHWVSDHCPTYIDVEL